MCSAAMDHLRAVGGKNLEADDRMSHDRSSDVGSGMADGFAALQNTNTHD